MTKRKSDTVAEATSYELTYTTSTFTGLQSHSTSAEVADALGQLHEDLTIISFKVERVVKVDVTEEFK